MLFRQDRSERLAGIADLLHSAECASAALVSAMACEICHADVNGAAAFSTRVQKLIAAGAWTDAAFALLAGELPQWKLRRLVYDEGEWHCALSLQRELPQWLDQAIETSHQDLSLALFRGIVEAARQEPAASDGSPTLTVPRIRVKQPDLVCCDNFA
ncbi:MAG: hypothetical protein K2X60_13665 [Xanthobacteraceae bacterium]|nr:hypothetical protein [Xanthobacteraceae bacterium]